MAVGLASWLQVDDAAAPVGAVALTSWLQIDGVPVVAAASAPSSVVGSATGGTTSLITWVFGGTGEDGFDVEVETPTSSGNWVLAAGAANPTALGVVSFAATGHLPAASHTPRVRSFNASGPSAWTVGDAFTTDNEAGGGGDIPFDLPDMAAPRNTIKARARRLEVAAGPRRLEVAARAPALTTETT